MLTALARHIPPDGWLVTYNGRGFDWPLLVTRYRMARRAAAGPWRPPRPPADRPPALPASARRRSTGRPRRACWACTAMATSTARRSRRATSGSCAAGRPSHSSRSPGTTTRMSGRWPASSSCSRTITARPRRGGPSRPAISAGWPARTLARAGWRRRSSATTSRSRPIREPRHPARPRSRPAVARRAATTVRPGGRPTCRPISAAAAHPACKPGHRSGPRPSRRHGPASGSRSSAPIRSDASVPLGRGRGGVGEPRGGAGEDRDRRRDRTRQAPRTSPARPARGTPCDRRGASARRTAAARRSTRTASRGGPACSRPSPSTPAGGSRRAPVLGGRPLVAGRSGCGQPAGRTSGFGMSASTTWCRSS